MAVFRLDRFLTECMIGSRNEVKIAIRKGMVRVDGEIVKRPEAKVDTDKSEVTYYGERVEYRQFYYYMLNKPAGVVTATEDTRDRTVLDLLDVPARKHLFPVGRLDKDTEGLLLLTNDGELSHRLLAPKKHVDKCYYVRVSGELTTEVVSIFSGGIDIGEKNLTMPAVLDILASNAIQSEAIVTIHEGKYHQIKRMFEKTGHMVMYLKRLSMGSLHLDEKLASGEYRELTDSEIQQLKEGKE